MQSSFALFTAINITLMTIKITKTITVFMLRTGKNFNEFEINFYEIK